MKGSIRINQAQIAEAIREYMERKGLPSGENSVSFTASPAETSYGMLTGGTTISATIEVDIGEPVAQ